MNFGVTHTHRHPNSLLSTHSRPHPLVPTQELRELIWLLLRCKASSASPPCKARVVLLSHTANKAQQAKSAKNAKSAKHAKTAKTAKSAPQPTEERWVSLAGAQVVVGVPRQVVGLTSSLTNCRSLTVKLTILGS